MIKVEQEVEIYEENGKEVPIGTKKVMGVESHWNRNEWVILRVGSNRVAIKARDLRAATENATNVSRF